jgi:hypothetical protein
LASIRKTSCALGQRVELVGVTGHRSGKPTRDLVEQLPSHGGREDRVSGGDRSHRRHDFLGGSVLEQKAAGAGAQRLDDVLVEPEGRQDQHALSRESPRRFDPVDPRHPDVHQDDVGCELSRGSDGFLAVACLGHHLDNRRSPRARL